MTTVRKNVVFLLLMSAEVTPVHAMIHAVAVFLRTSQALVPIPALLLIWHSIFHVMPPAVFTTIITNVLQTTSIYPVYLLLIKTKPYVQHTRAAARIMQVNSVKNIIIHKSIILKMFSFLKSLTSAYVSNFKKLLYAIYDNILILYGFLYVYIHIKMLNNKEEHWNILLIKICKKTEPEINRFCFYIVFTYYISSQTILYSW